MVNIKRRFKKILAILFIITLLSNYISILNEVGNVVFASSIELTPEFTSDINSINESNNETNNETEDSTISEQDNIKHEDDVEESIEENKINLNEVTEDETIDENNLTQEEMEKLNSIALNTELELNNFINFDNSDGKGVLAESTIAFNLDAKDLKADNMEIQFEVPNISGILPDFYEVEEVKSEGVELKDNITATHENNTISLRINNAESAKYEIKLVCVYSKEAFSKTEFKCSGTAKLEVLGHELLGNFEENKIAEETKETAATHKIISDTSSKYKGYLYANTMLENKKEFSYTTTDVLDITNIDFIDEFIIENTVDNIVSKENDKIPLANLSVYKSSSISKTELEEILGSDGCIEIYNQLGQKIGEINNKSEIKNDRYYFYYDTEVDRVNFKVRNLKNIGTLNIRNEKAIKGTDIFSREYVNSFKEIEVQTKNKAIKLINNNEVIVSSIYAENKVILEETETKAELSLSSNSFSSNMENEVTLNINLKTDSEQYELYKNPYIEVILPAQFENVEIKNINLLYKNGLSLSEWKIEKNEQNENVLIIKLEGVQEEYLPGIIKGTNINVDLALTLNELTTSNKGTIKLKYINEGGTNTSYENQGKPYDEYEIKYVSKAELLKVVYLNNVTDNVEIINSVNTDSNIGNIDINSNSKILNASFKYINNLKEDMNNVEIIGNIPFIGNVDGNNNELGTTIDATLKNAIKTSGLIAKVYYSEEANIESDSDLWQENITDYSKVKKFKISIDNNIIHQGESIQVEFDIKVPENLTYNQLISSSATIYYNLNGEERKDNIIIGVKTEENKEVNLEEYTIAENLVNDANEVSQTNLTIATKVSAGGKVLNDGDEVNERQILKYETIIKNNTDNAINNIELKGNAHNANMYYFYTYEAYSTTTGTIVTTGEWIEDTDETYKNATMNVPILNPGETIKFEYFVIVNNITKIGSDEKKVYGQIQIKADGINPFMVDTIKNNVRKAELELHLSIGDYEDINQMILETGGDFKLAGYVKNISGYDLKNISVSFILPEGVEYNRLTEYLHEEYIVTEEELSVGSIVTVTLSQLHSGEETIIYLLTDLHNFDISIPNKEISIYTKANLNGQEYLSNDYIRTITQTETKYDISYTSNKENGSTVQDGENIIYDYTIKNLGSVNGNITLTDYFPDGLIINSVKLYKEDGSVIDLPLISTDEDTLEDEVYGNEVEKIEYYDIEEEVDGVIEDDGNYYEDAIYVDEEPTLGLEGDLNYDYSIKPKETIKLKIDTTVSIENCVGEQEKIENSIGIASGEESSGEKTISYDIAYPKNYFDDITVEDSLIGDLTEVLEEQNTIENRDENISSDLTNQYTENEDLDQESMVETNTDNQVSIEETNNIYYDSNEEDYREVNILEYNDEKIKNDVKLDAYNSLKIFNTVSNKVDDNIIDGTVWLDKDKDGYYSLGEEKLSNQVIALYDLNYDAEVQRKQTDSQGNYAFYNVPNGNYVVVFYYDNEIYDITNYNSTTNEIGVSKAISIQESDNEFYAVSNEIKVSDSDISNVNIGLMNKNEFDLKIETYISSITVKTKKDSETYEYDEGDLAKVEIAARDIDGAELTAVLKIKITNNGNVIGYVSQLSNIIPEGWEFNEELNKNWILGNDRILYSSALENVLIQPDTSEEINLIITKIMTGNTTGVYKNEVKISNSSNILELKDINTENDKATVEFIVSIKTGVLTYIGYIIFAIVIFAVILYVINITLLKDTISKRKITINIIITAIIILIILIISIINNISNAGYVNTSGTDYIRHWATGKGATSSQATEDYSRLNDYMNNFYGAGTRSELLKKNYSFLRNDAQARTEQCLHGTSIGSDAALNKSFNTGMAYKIVSIVDFGWDNGAITGFNRMYGNYNNKVFKDTSKINVSNYINTEDQAQTMSYAAYMIENKGWGTIAATGTGLTFHRAYLAAIPTILRDFSGYNKNLKKVSAIYVGSISTETHTYKSDVKKAQAAFADFNNTNISAKNYGLTLDTARSDKIKIMDATGKATIKINKTYISGIKLKFPVKGRNKYLKNVTKIYISTNSGKTYKQYKGKVYKYSSSTKKYTAYSQDSTYFLNTSNNRFYNRSIYIPKSALGSSYTANKVRIKITNSYYTYASRFLYFFSTAQDQNKGVVRGKVITRNSYVIYRVGSTPGVKISKSVSSIDGSASNKTYVENGCQVKFAIKLECTGSGSINNITFTDNPLGFKYISCTGLTRNGTSFTYTGTINAGSSATVYITYEVTADNNINYNKVLTNTVEITSVKIPGNTSNIKGTSSIRSDSVYKASTTVKMKTYEAEINKFVYAVSDASNVTEYPDRSQNKSDTIYAEYNDQIIFGIEVKNTGDTGNSSTNGAIKNLKFTDTYNTSDLEYVTWSSVADTEYNFESEEDESDDIVESSEEDADSENTDESDGAEEDGEEETDDEFDGSEEDDGEGEDDDLAIVQGISYKASVENNINLLDTTNGITVSASNGNINFTIDELKTGDTLKIYVTFKVIRLSSSPVTSTNTVNITHIEQNHNKDITNLMSSSSIKSSSDSIRIKGYRASISKVIQSGVDNNNYAETGDMITYKITVANTGTSADYGNLRDVRIFDEYDSEDLTFVSYSANNRNFVKKDEATGTYADSGNWSKYRDSEGKYYSYYTYNSNITPGNSVTLYLKFKVKRLSKTNVTITNSAQITSANNKNNSNVADVLTNSKPSASFILKIYSLNVEKTITNVAGVAITNQSNVTCELGDIVTYNIKITNNGTSPNYGRIYSFDISEIFDHNQLEYDSTQTNYGTNWSLDKTTNILTNSNGIGLGSSSTITLKMKVILKSKDEVSITNTARIRTTNKVTNKNDVNIRSVLNGNLRDSADMKYLTYNVDVRKYITKYNSTNISGRINKTNAQKYDNPVEVEQNDTVNYTLRVENTGETNIHSITLQDTLESGIVFTNTNLESAKKYPSSSSNSGSNISSKVTITTNGLTRTLHCTEILNSGEVLILEFKATITKTNMYLLNLTNTLSVTSLTNKNNYDIVAENILNLDRNDNLEYVRLKNLIISGQVWLDKNEDGFMNDNINLSGIKVILHDDTNKKVAETYTDSNGKYIFSSTNGTLSNGSAHNKVMVEGGGNSGRVVKATNRNDTTGNYDSTSQYINYYVEFYYNGVRYENTVYSGRNNLNATNNAITNNYKIDSNALEYSDLREELKKNFETIEYNKAIRGTDDTGSNTKSISYDKNNHESLLQLTPSTAISAYSFVKTTNKNYGSGIRNGNNIDMLFFSQSGETEYLKYINLGLRARDLDLSITEDVYSLKTTINGSQMTYTFAQGNSSPYGGAYVTGGTSNPINYVFNIYASDYYYNRMKYENTEVQEYKKNTELNTEITYKMTIKNNDVGDTGKVYAKVREIVDYYSSDFIKYNPNDNTKKIKLMDDKGYLYDADIIKAEAWYEYNSNKGVVNISNNSRYPAHAKVNLNGKYNKVYLTGFDNINLKAGDSFDIFIKFTVSTENGTETTKLNLGEKNNIVEINAYSTYFESNNKPAGYADKNSNPGNLGLQTSNTSVLGTENASIERYSDYENDAYKTGITLTVQNTTTPNPNNPTPSNTPEGKLERVLTGTVWDDARSEAIWDKSKASKIEDATDLQYIGNGLMNVGGSSPDKRFKQSVGGVVYEPASNQKKINNKLIHNESTDIYAEGISVNLVEIIKIPNSTGGEKIYEETGEHIATWSKAIVSSRSTSNGSYKLESFIPGNYILRFRYGENKADVAYNGQEYKSTVFDSSTDYTKTIDELASGNVKQDADNVLNTLEKAGRNDARDDEIRRLEVISYSEIVNNQKTEEAQEVENYSDSFMNNTYMDAETVTFPVRSEKVTYDVTTFDFSQTNNKLFKIQNIDFGLEYRPEVSVSIKEFLSEIKLTTSAGDTLVNIKFDNQYENNDSTRRIIGTTPNTKESIGLNNLQYLPSINDVKGLAYLNIDTDLLQGCTIEITYVFNVDNVSENDRVSKKLYDLKYKVDANNLGYNSFLDDTELQDEYTAAGTARNELYASFYSGNVYRNKVKAPYNGTDGYYGKYLGTTYYTGNIGTDDVLSEIKIDKILDYVDNDMTMPIEKNSSNDKSWTVLTDKELYDQGLVSKDVFSMVNTSSRVNGALLQVPLLKLIDTKGISYDSDDKHNLAVSIDDKVSENDQTNMNKSLSKFLTTYLLNPSKSSGNIYMTTLKVLASKSDTEDMTYDNSAEIIQYTSSTGRVTSLAATVGNLDMKGERTSLPNYGEPDEDFTERVTLTPPTGLEKARYYISVAKDTVISITIAIAVVIIAIVLKKNLEKVTFKKFYK